MLNAGHSYFRALPAEMVQRLEYCLWFQFMAIPCEEDIFNTWPCFTYIEACSWVLLIGHWTGLIKSNKIKPRTKWGASHLLTRRCWISSEDVVVHTGLSQPQGEGAFYKHWPVWVVLGQELHLARALDTWVQHKKEFKQRKCGGRGGLGVLVMCNVTESTVSWLHTYIKSQTSRKIISPWAIWINQLALGNMTAHLTPYLLHVEVSPALHSVLRLCEAAGGKSRNIYKSSTFTSRMFPGYTNWDHSRGSNDNGQVGSKRSNIPKFALNINFVPDRRWPQHPGH